MKRWISIVLMPLVFLSFYAPFDSSASDETWKKEFERICSMVEVAGELKPEEVMKLLNDADTLLELFESGMKTDRQMKVYSFRLKKCRNFFQYIYKTQLKKAG